MTIEKPEIIHGQNCPKATHWRDDHFYLHLETWDGPFVMDGVMYCGRCHEYLSPEVSR